MSKNKSSGIFLFSAGFLTLILGLYLILFESKKFTTNMAIMSVGFAVIGFLYALYIIIRKLVDPNVVLGFSSLMSALLVSGGMMMLML